MSTRKNGKLTRLIALAINLQLVITTSAFADSNNTFQNIDKAIGTVQQIGGAAMQGMQQMQMQQMADQQQAMMQQQFGLSPVDPTQIPKILSDNGCMVLPARPDYPVDKCEKYDAMQAQSGYYTALLSVAENNENDIENFLTSGHQRFSTQGVGCYEKALKQFRASLNARVEALNGLEKSIDAVVDDFLLQTKAERENIRRGNALLEGTPKELIKDIKFDEKFSDPQCKSFITPASIKKNGSQGFRGIQSGIEQVLSQTKPHKFKGQQNSIRNEIKKIAKKVGKLAQKKKAFSVDPGKLGIRSKFFSAGNSTLKAIINESSSDAMSEVQDLNKDMSKLIGSNDAKAKSILKGIQDDSVDLDNALFDYERNKKNTCLNKYLKSNFGGVTGIAGKLKDPSISAKANRESDSAFKNTITSILSDDEYTIEEKIARIKKAEGKKGNDRWSFTTGKSVNIKGKEIGASTRLRASDMISIFTDNCTQRFESLRNDKGKSDRDVVTNLKNYKTKYHNLQKKFATTIQEKIISEMVNCPSEQTEGTGASSCSGALDMNSGNFCLRTANVCAGNMIACKDKADKIVETTRMEQKNLAKAYKTKVDIFKAQLTQTFMATNKIMEGQARQLDGMYQFGSTYSIPMKLDLNLVGNSKSLLSSKEGFDPSLMLENPEAYREKVKKNITELKKSVKAQNEEILNGKATEGMTAVGQAGQASQYKGLIGEINKYQDNYKAQVSKWGEIKKSCSAMIDQHNNMIAEQNSAAEEADNEYNAKVGDICKKVQGFNDHPAGFCGEASELGDSIFEIGAVAGDSSAAASLKEFDNTCDSYNNETGDNTVDNSFFVNREIASNTTPEKFCKEFGKEVNACGIYTGFIGDFGNIECDSSLQSLAKDEKKLSAHVRMDKDNKAIQAYENIALCEQGYPSAADHGQTCISKPLKDITDSVRKVYVSANAESLMSEKNFGCYDLDELGKYRVSRYEKAQDIINEYIAQGKRAKQVSSLGHINVSFCNANYGGDIGKEFLQQMGQQPGRGLAGAGGYSQ